VISGYLLLSYLPAVFCHDEIKAKKSFVFSISSWLPVVLIDYSKEIKHNEYIYSKVNTLKQNTLPASQV